MSVLINDLKIETTDFGRITERKDEVFAESAAARQILRMFGATEVTFGHPKDKTKNSKIIFTIPVYKTDSEGNATDEIEQIMERELPCGPSVKEGTTLDDCRIGLSAKDNKTWVVFVPNGGNNVWEKV